MVLLWKEIRRRGLKISVAGIPKTIDNDIPVIEKSFGFDTALEETQRATNAAHVESKIIENGIGLVKLIGRYSGFIAMHATLAIHDVDCCLIPESAFYLKGRDPTYMIRAIPSIGSDNFYCNLLAHAAVHGAMVGYTGFTVGPVNGIHAYIPFSGRVIVEESKRQLKNRRVTGDKRVSLGLKGLSNGLGQGASTTGGGDRSGGFGTGEWLYTRATKPFISGGESDAFVGIYSPYRPSNPHELAIGLGLRVWQAQGVTSKENLALSKMMFKNYEAFGTAGKKMSHQKEQTLDIPPQALDTPHPHNTHSKNKKIEVKIAQLEENMLRLQKELEEKISQNNQNTLESITKSQESLVDQIIAKLAGLNQASTLGAGTSEGAKKMEEKIKQLEDQMKVVKGDHDYYGVDSVEQSLVPDLVLPPKFKSLEFEKFDGNRCLSAHITMFCRKMTGYVGNDQLLIHCFQESLSGSAIWWYNQLNRSHIKTLKDLSKSFLKQYKHVNDIRPDRVMLQIIVGKMIEMAIKQGKIEGGDTSKKPPMKKRDREVNNINKGVTFSNPKSTTVVPSSTSRQDSRNP
ncbi:ATP-dependent 6-phosphofructokinase 6 [Hibiscus syriacus]|uniref:ATP-dependent 6-phosphofructokinase 6 n=1 Tax=Hibiscus syriacus TaxID=106335 RepID=A0A6A2WC80_HIBSY|nr:ATP-dependent 6-phosphofructokinase 6 [Hibiscus syriacus]